MTKIVDNWLRNREANKTWRAVNVILSKTKTGEIEVCSISNFFFNAKKKLKIYLTMTEYVLSRIFKTYAFLKT